MRAKTITIPAGAFGIDFSSWRPSVAELRALNVSVVFVYAALGGAWKRLTLAGIQTYLDAGIAVVLLVEEAKDSWLQGYAKGRAHGLASAKVADAFGYPQGLPIVPAWDTYVAPNDQRALDYGNGFADAIEPSAYRLGVYAGLPVIRMLNHRSVFNFLAGAASWSAPRDPDGKYRPERQPDYDLVHARQTISGSTPNLDAVRVLKAFEAWLPHDVADTPATQIELPQIVLPDTATPIVVAPSHPITNTEDAVIYFTHSDPDDNGNEAGHTYWALMPDGSKRHVDGIELDVIARGRDNAAQVPMDQIRTRPDYVAPSGGGSTDVAPRRFKVTLTGDAEA
jgi:hypothetical protein